MEEARDWASHLQHFLSILAEFDNVGALDELTMIRYFWKGLKPSIKVEMEQQDRALTSFKERVQRALNVEAKAGLRSSTMVRDSDARCPREDCLSHNTSSKMQSQGSNNKDSSRSEEPKPKDPKPAPPHDNAAAEPAKKEDRKDKKKRFRGQRREHTGERKEQTPATGVNKTAPKKKLKVRYFNCNKKGHYANNCIKPPKN